MRRRPAQGRNLAPGQFFGEVVRSGLCSGIVLSELRHASPRRLPSHAHELAYFCLLLDGGYSEQFGSRTVAYQPMTVGFHPGGVIHCDEIASGGGRFFCAEVSPSWLERLREHGPLPRSFPDLHGGELTWLALRLYREFHCLDECSALSVEGLVLEMLAVATRARLTGEKRPPAWLGRVKDLLHSEFQRRLRLDEMASVAGVHPVHLARVFRQFENETVGEHVQRLRVQFASRQLLSPGSSLAQIALDSGFSDQSHFARVFKKLTGMSPGAFRSKRLALELVQFGASPPAAPEPDKPL